jgi:hypothetical protein
MILNTNLPAFNGYYGSIFDDVDTSSELDYINEIRLENGLPELENDYLIEWNYKSYYSELNIQLCNCVEDFLIELDIIKSIEFVALHSPKYYNFTNDVIECKIDVNSKNIRKYINNNLEEFTAHLIENHKSRDGFSSFYEYDLDFWLDRMDNFKQLDHNEIHSILNFICENEGFDLVDSLYNGNFDYIILQAENFNDITTVANE